MEPVPMSRTHNEAGRTSKLRASLIGLLIIAHAGCDSTDRLTSDTSGDASEVTVNLSPTTRSGIPFGAFAQPLSMYGSTYTGGHLNPQPASLLSSLALLRSAGARVDLTFAGSPINYTNADGTFNFSMWKARVDRYSSIDFTPYISDGTVIGHYLIDQPQCSTCWGGQAIPHDTVEAMAQYSKQYWPTMTTIARAAPTSLREYSGPYVYLDAGWAQYTVRQGDINSFIADNVAAAQAEGLGLIVGLNVLKGGDNLSSLTASQIKTFGPVLLSSPYVCAFISWQYESEYFSRSDIKSAMEFLSKKAKRHARTSCQQ
jgi:hypothetical protein